MKFIAELCQNHNGDMNIVEKMVRKAAIAGAHFCKIQTILARDLIYWKHHEEFRPYEAEYQRLKSLELSFEDEQQFIEICKKWDVKPMTTIFNHRHPKRFNNLGYEYLKISGYKMKDIYKQIKEFNFKHLYFSTSSLTFFDIKKIVKFLQLNNIKFTMLNCTCVYPTSLDKLNLQNIPFYKKEFNLDNVGLSDHSNPYEDNLLSSKLAIFQGIDVLERHFTILDKDETRDGKVSVTPEMIVELINFSKLSKINQYKEINKFNEKQVFNHSYYSTRF